SRLQSFFSTFTIVDVSKEQIPRAYLVFRIAHGKTADLEPSVNAISAAATVLNLINLACLDRLFPRINDARKVIRVNRADEGPVFQLPACSAEILQGLAVKKLDLAPCTRRCHQAGNVVNDLPPGELTRTHRILSPLAILNVYTGSVPF